MVQLFLSEPPWNDVSDEESVKKQVSLLDELESAIWSLLKSSGSRSEARLWLCDSLSCINSISSDNQHELFEKILRSKPKKRALAAQVLQMIFEKQPRKAGRILAKRSHLLEDFFRDNPRRILQWFSHFAAGGNLGHAKGAKALSHFAFINRDICWEELEWKGKHGQSPAMVATKPHYFLDLDVQQTVKNFLEHVPEFWSSNEFADSLENGEILFMDKQYFLDFFVDLMFKENSYEIWDLVNEFLMEEPFSSLCHHLLIVLEEQELSTFLDILSGTLNVKVESTEFGNSSYWLEILLEECSDCTCIEKLILLNSVISQGRKLLRLVHEEENEEEKVKMKNVVEQISMCSTHPCSLVQKMKESSETETVELVKWLGLHSWALHYRLAEEIKCPERLGSLLRGNGISFRRDNKYELLDHDNLSIEWGSNLDDKSSEKVRKKKKKERRKKRRKNSDDDDSYSNDLDIDVLEKGFRLQSGSEIWLLLIDGYTTSWTSVDLPEHLSKHCFSTWMKWIFQE